MAYVSYQLDGVRRVGELTGETVVPLIGIDVIDANTSTDKLAAAQRDASSSVALADVTLLPVSSPRKLIAVGLNYRDHIVETKRDFPQYPVMFPKYADSLLGADATIELPPESTQVDYEGEMAIVIGRGGRRIAEADALDHVLGYTVCNDITMRDFQYKTHQWMQGKAWDASTPIGPAIVTPGEIDIAKSGIRTILNGEKVQESDLSQLIFTVPNLIATISVFTKLECGDIILTGTPGGVGFRRDPKLLLRPGDHVSAKIDGLGAVSNNLVAENA